MGELSRPRRVVAIASGGGHWIQLQRLQPAFEGFDVAFVSVHRDYADDVPGRRYYVVPDVTRRNAIVLLLLIPRLALILLRERPDVVITTGAAPGVMGLALARLFTPAKTIWIDSIANCEKLSTSGRQARRFAHEWLTQWPQLATPSGPHFWGAVL